MTGKKTTTPAGKARKPWVLRLYVSGQTTKAMTAFTNLRKICEEHLAGEYTIEVIDLLKSPQLARIDEIIALPTLIREVPGRSPRKIIGDLSNAEKVLMALDLRPHNAGAKRRI